MKNKNLKSGKWSLKRKLRLLTPKEARLLSPLAMQMVKMRRKSNQIFSKALSWSKMSINTSMMMMITKEIRPLFSVRTII